MREYKFRAWVKPVIENEEVVVSGYMIKKNNLHRTI